jgi:hypothetical protein
MVKNSENKVSFLPRKVWKMATRGAVYNNKLRASAVGTESQYFLGQKNINIDYKSNKN